MRSALLAAVSFAVFVMVSQSGARAFSSGPVVARTQVDRPAAIARCPDCMRSGLNEHSSADPAEIGPKVRTVLWAAVDLLAAIA